MTTASTELDTRFSEPGAQPTSWQDTLEAIEHAEIFWISTVRADGRPHVTPLVAVWLDDALHFSTGASEQKALNLAKNSRVALITGTNDWQSGSTSWLKGTRCASPIPRKTPTAGCRLGGRSGTGAGDTPSMRRAFATTSGPHSCSSGSPNQSARFRQRQLQPHQTSLLRIETNVVAAARAHRAA